MKSLLGQSVYVVGFGTGVVVKESVIGGDTMWRTEQIIQAVEQMLLSTKLLKIEEWLAIQAVSIKTANFKCLNT